MTSKKIVEYKLDGAVAVVTMAKPPHNLLDGDLLDGITAAPWKFSKSVPPEPGQPSFQGEHNDAVFKERKVSKKKLDNLRAWNIILSRRHRVGEFDL